VVTKKDVLDRRKEMSDKISTQVRTLSVGLLAFTWGLLVSDSALAKEMTASLKWHLLVIGGMAIVVVLLDFLQYSFGHEVALKLLRQMEVSKAKEGEYNYDDPLWRLQNWLFYAKQVLLSCCNNLSVGRSRYVPGP
jgi:hypothetical protein